jgi:hypothetical protein
MIKINLSGHENAALAALGFSFNGALQVDLADPELLGKVVNYLRQVEGLNSGDGQITIVLPGLAPLAAITLAAVHGITGCFPIIQPMVRGANGSFEPGQWWDLQTYRNDIARCSRSNIVVL